MLVSKFGGGFLAAGIVAIIFCVGSFVTLGIRDAALRSIFYRLDVFI